MSANNISRNDFKMWMNDYFNRQFVDRMVSNLVNEKVDNVINEKVELYMHRKIPDVFYNYVNNYKLVNEIVNNAKREAAVEVEKKTREIMRKVTSEDQYQNPVFGEFKNNLSDKCDQVINDKISTGSAHRWFNTVGIMGAVGVGLYMLSKKE